MATGKESCWPRPRGMNNYTYMKKDNLCCSECWKSVQFEFITTEDIFSSRIWRKKTNNTHFVWKIKSDIQIWKFWTGFSFTYYNNKYLQVFNGTQWYSSFAQCTAEKYIPFTKWLWAEFMCLQVAQQISSSLQTSQPTGHTQKTSSTTITTIIPAQPTVWL